MSIDRREFLLASGLLALGGKSVFAAAAPKLRLGVISDIHLERRGLRDETYVYGSDTVFRKTLRYFRDRKVDVVVIAGDMANLGTFEQLKLAADDWFEVFPDCKGADGERVEPFFIYGNHDVGQWGGKGNVHADPAGSWKRAFGWDWSPVYSRTVKGYTFVGAHWGHEKEVGAYLDAHKAELAGTKPFFYVQHNHIGGTVKGSYGGDPAASPLAAFPNAVVLSGHSHWPLSDPGSVWQGAFTAIGTSSLAYLWQPHAMDGHETRDPRSAMPWASDCGRDAMVIDVHDGFLAIERRQMVDGDEIGPVRNVAVPPKSGAESFAFDEQMKREAVPQFPAGAKLVETREQGTDRGGAIQNQVVLRFPSAAVGPHGERPNRYAVTVYEPGNAKSVFSAYVIAPYFFRNPRHVPATVEARIPADKLPFRDGLVYEVAPVDCWDRRGKALRVEA